jgi:FKBP-type peptidyl-prolyl cis-trans isomerase FkpA
MKRLMIVAAAAVFFSGCLKSEDEVPPCSYNECGVKAPAAEIENVKAYLLQNSLTPTEHCSGMFYSIDSVGTGTAPTACAAIAARYKGMLTNGAVFDSGVLTSTLTRLIPGWRNGLPKIKAGGGMRLYIPPTLGYGAEDVKNPNTGQVVIPGNSILVFEVKLDAVGR